MRKRFDLVVIGLSLSSSWGNGHATTYRALLRGLALLGHRILFLERNVPWYGQHRDLPTPDFCELALYDTVAELRSRYSSAVADAEAVIVGSYVPDGIDVLDWALETGRSTVAFYDIDTPITLAALAKGRCAYIAVRQIPRLHLYLSFTAGPTLGELSSRFGARQAAPLYCAVDETIYQPLSHARRWDLGYLGTYSEDRQATLERLLINAARRLPQKRFVVAGPQYPADVDWPGNVERIDHLPPQEHAAFYAAQRFTLNVTRADMIAVGWSPSVRLFEAAACGTPIISDRWPGLTSLFPEHDAILIADNGEFVEAALSERDDKFRKRIAERALGIVREQHTGIARARTLQGYLVDAAARRAKLATALMATSEE